MKSDYYFDYKEPVAYEVKNGKLSKRLRGIVRRTALADKSVKPKYAWAQIVNGKVVAFFKSNQIAFMKNKAA